MTFKTLILCLLSLLFLGCQPSDDPGLDGPSPTSTPIKSAHKGEPSPKLNLTAPDGSTVTFNPSDNPDNEAFLLVFWSQQWDPNARTLLDRVEELHERYAPRGLTVIAVSYDDEPSGLRKYLNANPLPFEVAVGAASTLSDFQVTSIPTAILVDSNGRIVERWSGYYSTEEWAEAISPHLPGRTGNSEK